MWSSAQHKSARHVLASGQRHRQQQASNLEMTNRDSRGIRRQRVPQLQFAQPCQLSPRSRIWLHNEHRRLRPVPVGLLPPRHRAPVYQPLQPGSTAPLACRFGCRIHHCVHPHLTQVHCATVGRPACKVTHPEAWPDMQVQHSTVRHIGGRPQLPCLQRCAAYLRGTQANVRLPAAAALAAGPSGVDGSWSLTTTCTPHNNVTHSTLSDCDGAAQQMQLSPDSAAGRTRRWARAPCWRSISRAAAPVVLLAPSSTSASVQLDRRSK
jgi:hypothetical protein